MRQAVAARRAVAPRPDGSRRHDAVAGKDCGGRQIGGRHPNVAKVLQAEDAACQLGGRGHRAADRELRARLQPCRDGSPIRWAERGALPPARRQPVSRRSGRVARHLRAPDLCRQRRGARQAATRSRSYHPPDSFKAATGSSARRDRADRRRAQAYRPMSAPSSQRASGPVSPRPRSSCRAARLASGENQDPGRLPTSSVRAWAPAAPRSAPATCRSDYQVTRPAGGN